MSNPIEERKLSLETKKFYFQVAVTILTMLAGIYVFFTIQLSNNEADIANKQNEIYMKKIEAINRAMEASSLRDLEANFKVLEHTLPEDEHVWLEELREIFKEKKEDLEKHHVIDYLIEKTEVDILNTHNETTKKAKIEFLDALKMQQKME